ncbi:hypothetical protein NL30_36500 [Burkholderia contaminans]|uniref:hypothetical protein n=1 Tax=Burkholderia contaminans TaxID=488447 RepID=UPI0006497B28|nr:hypothetical protein [Burkholderia contaminans]AKM45343.1 hypothetical protein NL30_36500 [Burkholderia contaminans]
MSGVVGLPAAIVSGYRALPFLLRRLILVLVYSLIFAAGAFMHNRGAGDVAMLFLLAGAIGTWWASGAWRILKIILFLVFVVVGH